jgi:hypothetical protein
MLKVHQRKGRGKELISAGTISKQTLERQKGGDRQAISHSQKQGR